MKYLGARVPGQLSHRLVAGCGAYINDIRLDGMLYMAVVRSVHAHALIKRIDVSKAEQVQGVVCVVTGKEIKQNTRPIMEAYDKSVSGAKSYDWYALCVDRVRYVGEAVAAVVANDRYTARKAADLVDVDYEDQPAVTDSEEAMKPGAPLVEPSWGDNVPLIREFTTGDPDKAFAEADGTVSGQIRTQRYMATPIEPRGYVADYDRAHDRLTLWASTQNPHPLRTSIATILDIPESNIRVIQPNVGGAFGSKIPTYQEEPLTAYLAYKLRRPVKWIEERIENFQVGGHAREQRIYYEAAYKNDGKVTGLKVRIIADVGAPTSLVGWEMSLVTAACVPTVYKIPNCHVAVYPVVTNKCPWNAYRGYGKETASFLMDRVMDAIAKSSGLDQTEVRFKNFIQPDEFPFPQASGVILDSGNYPKALSRVLEMIDYRNFSKVKEAALKEGRYIGLGLGQELTPEGCALPNSIIVSAYDGSTVKVNPSGQVTVYTGVTSPGSCNETGIAQIVADSLGVDVKLVKVFQGDTELCPYGLGNDSARSVMIGGSAAYLAAMDIRQKMFKVAGKMLEVAPEDLDAEDGAIYVKGAPARAVKFQKVAHTIFSQAYGKDAGEVEPGLETTRYFRTPNIYHMPEVQGRFNPYPLWPNAAVACIVEVDPETGRIKILRYCIVHDSGVIVNPLLAEGNLHGGITQGLGGAIYENLVYDEGGQLKTATFMDYTPPTAVDVPHFEIEHQETPTPFTPLGCKGVGESGITGPLGALCSAVEDAMSAWKVRITQMPLKPDQVWRAIQEARQNGS